MTSGLSLNDPTSYANTEDFVICNTVFNWNLDFNEKCIQGSVEHTINTKNAAATELTLDANKLLIKQVKIDGAAAPFEVNEKHSQWGKLTVKIEKPSKKFQLLVEYVTTNQCSALQWLEPSMTLGGEQPYLYSQCQAIHARTLFPCQDTPGVKATYQARVTAPKALEVLMSAVKKTTEGGLNSGDASKTRTHVFEQALPVPSYLVAVVAGRLAGKRVGPRSTVWTEPGMLEAAAFEFEGLDNILTTAEAVVGLPYEWGVYDLLILPPAFPYGGMENPCLTFVTPCLISGERSQVHVVAHEIAHSWTGNLVTNSNWDDFWINEGHTNYLERLILESMEKSSAYRHLHISIGLAELKESMDIFNKDLGPDHEFCKLRPHLVDIDPDDAFSRVPYEKGSLLLFYLESIVGKDKMKAWLKSYLSHFRLGSVDSDQWKAFFLNYMTETGGVPQQKLDVVDWDAWFYGTKEVPVPIDTFLNGQLTQSVESLADRWMAIKPDAVPAPTAPEAVRLREEYGVLLPCQKHLFFRLLANIRCVELHWDVLSLMDNASMYKPSVSRDTEILYGWSLLCLQSRFPDAEETVFNFLNSNGRLMYNKPIYSGLMKWPEMRERALANFLSNETRMNPITREEVRKITLRPNN